MTQANELTNGKATIAENETSGQRHLVIKVKDFARNPATNRLMTSYLRLGAVRDEMGACGDDKRLAEMVTGFADDDRERTDYPDQGKYDGVTPQARADLSSKLHTLGGWRDHSDGNRISTTRGDKVEVIRGNYKMLVLGRQDAADQGAAYDASGGLITDGDIAPGAVTDIRWIKDEFTGTWRVHEESAKGDVVTRYHGIVKEEFLGSLQETIVGSESGHQPELPADLGNDTPCEYTEAERIAGTTIPIEAATDGWSKPDQATVLNPVIREKKWARSMEYHNGSSAKKVGRIVERTYAEKIDTKITADQIDEERNADYFGKNTKVATEHWFGAFNELFIGTHASLRVAGGLEVTAGAGIEAFMGAALQVFMGGVVEFTWARKLEVAIGNHKEVNYGVRTSTGTITERDSVVDTVKASITKHNVLLGFYG